MKFLVEHSGESRTYAMLWHVASQLLDVAKTNETGFLLQLQASAVFHAFTFEAYLNHVGSQEIEFWEETERTISYREKLLLLSKRLKFKFESGRRPFQTIWDLFDLRDDLAHGKTTEFKDESVTSQDPPDDSAWCVLPWEKLTFGDLERFSEDLKAAIETINQARSTPDQFLWNEGARSTQISVIRPPNEPSTANGALRRSKLAAMRADRTGLSRPNVALQFSRAEIWRRFSDRDIGSQYSRLLHYWSFRRDHPPGRWPFGASSDSPGCNDRISWRLYDVFVLWTSNHGSLR